MSATGTDVRVVNIIVPKRCGTCKHWEFTGAAMQRIGWCTFDPGPLPFWAHLDRGHDHADATAETDGKNCDTYQMDVTKDVSA